MFTKTSDNSLTCASDCRLQRCTAAMQRPVRRINPNWVGWLEAQCGSRSVDHHFCWWFAVAFISFTLATAQSLCGWRLIARQHMVPLASDHSTTCLSKCVSLPPASPCSWEEYILTGHKLAHYLYDMHALSFYPLARSWDCCRANVTRCSEQFAYLCLVNIFIIGKSRRFCYCCLS